MRIAAMEGEHHRHTGAGSDGPDLVDDPDYIDRWMEKNMTASVVSFVQAHCTSFTRWAILRKLHESRDRFTAESLAMALGIDIEAIRSDLERFVAAGLVTKGQHLGRIYYRLGRNRALNQALDTVVRAFGDSQEFRFALVYVISRATHRRSGPEQRRRVAPPRRNG